MLEESMEASKKKEEGQEKISQESSSVQKPQVFYTESMLNRMSTINLKKLGKEYGLMLKGSKKEIVQNLLSVWNEEKWPFPSILRTNPRRQMMVS